MNVDLWKCHRDSRCLDMMLTRGLFLNKTYSFLFSRLLQYLLMGFFASKVYNRVKLQRDYKENWVVFVRRAIGIYCNYLNCGCQKRKRESGCILTSYFSYHYWNCCNNCDFSNSSSNSGGRLEFSGGFYGFKWIGMQLKVFVCQTHYSCTG